MENIPLKEIIERIEKPKREYDLYFKNTLNFWPKSWIRFFKKYINT